jgi:SSS family solute:Na+ symporter
METLFYGKALFGHSLTLDRACWVIGLIAAAYVAAGGLKACAWADLLQGSALIAGGLAICWLAFDRLGDTPVAELMAGSEAMPVDLADSTSGLGKFFALNGEKLHMVLPRGHPDLPWTALLFGLWIPNFYYWGLNQFIVQRTLGSKSLAAGQKGVITAAAIHVVSPLFIVIPGLIAFNLFSGEMSDSAARDPQVQAANAEVLERYETDRQQPEPELVIEMDRGWRARHPGKAAEIERHNAGVMNARTEKTEHLLLTGFKYDAAFPLLIRNLVPSGLRGFILAAILGAIISSLAAMLNSASSIFTMDLYRKHLVRGASEMHLVRVGRACVVVFVIIGCWLAPKLGDPQFGGIFKFIQEFQGYISPGILAAFVFGLLVRRAPAAAGIAALLGNPAVYGLLSWLAPGIPFLDRMAVSFTGIIAVMALITWRRPLPAPVEMPQNPSMDLTPSTSAKWVGGVVVVIILSIYWIFR